MAFVEFTLDQTGREYRFPGVAEALLALTFLSLLIIDILPR